MYLIYTGVCTSYNFKSLIFEDEDGSTLDEHGNFALTYQSGWV